MNCYVPDDILYMFLNVVDIESARTLRLLSKKMVNLMHDKMLIEKYVKYYKKDIV